MTQQTDSEVERIRRVYAGYSASKAKRNAWSAERRGNRRLAKDKEDTMRALLAAEGMTNLEGMKILEIGCGDGKNLAFMESLGALRRDLTGIDLLPDRIEEAKAAYPGMTFLVSNAEGLDFPDESFDIVMVYVVFSSILDDRMTQNIAGEMHRILKPGGWVLWDDLRYDNPRNKNVRAIHGPELARLFPGYRIRMKSTALLPPLAVRLGALSPLLYPLLHLAPFLRSHIMAVLNKPENGANA